MSDDTLAKRIEQAQRTPARINPWAVVDQGWRGATVPGAPKRKIYTVLQNEEVLVTLLLRFPGETGPVGAGHYHDSGELSISFEGGVTPSVGWSPPGHPHLHGAARNPGKELGDIISQVAQDGGPNQETVKLATQLSQLLQVPVVGNWLDDLFKPEPHLIVALDILFPPFTTYVAEPGGGFRKVVGQWYD